MALTQLQYLFMDAVAHCEMNQGNGATPECADEVNTYLWADERAAKLKITRQAVGGVITSLTEAGMIGVRTADKKDKDGAAWFTEEGFEAWAEYRAMLAANEAAEPALLTNRQIINEVWKPGKIRMCVYMPYGIEYICVEKADLERTLRQFGPEDECPWQFMASEHDEPRYRYLGTVSK